MSERGNTTLKELVSYMIELTYQCFPSWNCAFFDDLKVSKNCFPFCNSCFCLDLFHLCSAASISIIRGSARCAASVSRKARRHLLATKSTADSQYSSRAQQATSASKKGYPCASRFPKFSFYHADQSIKMESHRSSHENARK